MRAHVLNGVLALLFSVIVWCAVGAQLTEQDSVTIDFRIKFPKDVILTYKGRTSSDTVLVLDDEVTVEVRGPKEQIIRLSQLGLEGRFELSKERKDELLRKGEELTIDPAKFVVAPKPLEVVRADPPELRVRVQRVDHRLVWVQPGELQGQPTQGYRHGEVTVNPRRVAVRGAAEVLEANPGPYKTEPIDIDRAEETFEVERAVIAPDGVAAQRRVLVTVEILPDLVEMPVEFPVNLLAEAPRDGQEPIAPLGFRIVARDGWLRHIQLRGPRDVLERLKESLDMARIGGRFDADLPKAYVLASEVKSSKPQPGGLLLNMTVEVTGLPKGVEYVRKAEFPVRLVPSTE